MLDSPGLVDLSRAASVISTSSEDSVLPDPPTRVRSFSSPRSTSRPKPSTHAPSYLRRELEDKPESEESQLAAARARSSSRNKPYNLNDPLTADDFVFGSTLGEGSYSTVVRGTLISTGEQYAIKIMDKMHLIRNNKAATAAAEKNALLRLGTSHPGIIRLRQTFQDESSLYFVLELVKNGEMQSLVSRLGSLSTTCTQYYAAQIVDTVAYMHSKGVIHRDLKPENILLDDNFRIRITDFGTGKILGPGIERSNTFVGTSQFVSPELLESTQSSKSSDIWALGCIIYQMIAGKFAFQGLSDYLTWQKIKRLDYTFPEGFDENAKDLVTRILVRDPDQRLGAGSPGSSNDMESLQSHPFFHSIEWITLWTIPSPLLQPGLVARDQSLNVTQPQWEDIGAAWDALVANENDIEWASDGEGAEFERASRNGIATQNHLSTEVGPINERPRYRSPTRAESSRAVTPRRHSDLVQSGSGSSEENAISKLADDLGQVAFPSVDEDDTESTRGRNRVLAPIQGNRIDITSFLNTGEILVHQSTVQARSLRRRASRLLNLPVGPDKLKPRELVLTSKRLLCIKQQRKNPGTLVLKHEFSLQVADNPKSKKTESRAIVASVEPKGEREFVILTSAKNYTYLAEDSTNATAWLDKINRALRP